jgi:hypothetical protein
MFNRTPKIIQSFGQAFSHTLRAAIPQLEMMPSMNKWECHKTGCTMTANGVGGAIGLRAIGWYWKAGNSPLYESELYCPIHWPKEHIKPAPQDCLFRRVEMCTAQEGELCSHDTTEQQADKLQIAMGGNGTHIWEPAPEIP